jgi:hypothetical protein
MLFLAFGQMTVIGVVKVLLLLSETCFLIIVKNDCLLLDGCMRSGNLSDYLLTF